MSVQTRTSRFHFEDWILERVPRWLKGPPGTGWGELFFRSIGAVFDTVLDGHLEAVRAGIVEKAPDDALPYHAKERELERYPDETLAAWRFRLAHAWEEWERGGRNDGIERNIGLYIGAGFTAVEARSWWDWGTVAGTNHSNVWCIIGDGAVDLPWEKTLLGDPEWTLGNGWTLGSTATRREVLEIATLTRKWGSAHSYKVCIILVFPGESLPDPYDYSLVTWKQGHVLGQHNLTMPFQSGGYRIQ
jgi:hypothetical protein